MDFLELEKFELIKIAEPREPTSKSLNIVFTKWHDSNIPLPRFPLKNVHFLKVEESKK
jgi:hypothetical protein